MIIFKGFLLILGGLIALFSARTGKLPRGLIEWLIWGIDAYIIVKEVIL